MTEIQLTSDITVRKIQSMGGDFMVIAAAKVSVNPTEAWAFAVEEATENNYGLIKYLMKMHHGTPFEHSAVTFFVHAPIFVWREWHRHRIGFSYNEESGRYSQLKPVFYIPPRDRPMVKVDNWKPGRPKFMTLDEFFGSITMKLDTPDTEYDSFIKERGDEEYCRICNRLEDSYRVSYKCYEQGLKSRALHDYGIDIELDPGLARDCLPVGIYSSCWVTCNPRSLMSFLSLRTHEPEAKFPSYPLYEIEIAARAAEQILKEGWPITYQAWVDFGRVAP